MARWEEERERDGGEGGRGEETTRAEGGGGKRICVRQGKEGGEKGRVRGRDGGGGWWVLQVRERELIQARTLGSRRQGRRGDGREEGSSNTRKGMRGCA